MAIDTEYDSFRYFREKLCLVQVSTENQIFLFDPLADFDMRVLNPYFSDANILKIFHAGDNDIRLLKRDLGATFNSIFDTQVAAKLEGESRLKLPVLLEKYLGQYIPKSKKVQRSKWEIRPLSATQIQYAILDIYYLPALYECLNNRLQARGKIGQAAQLFTKITEVEWQGKVYNGNEYRRVMERETLNERQINQLKKLCKWRFDKAKVTNRAPFRILSNRLMLMLVVNQGASLSPQQQVQLRAEIAGSKYQQEIFDLIYAE